MALEYGAIWAIDIGSNSLKALHLTNQNGIVEVIGFDSIQHGKIITNNIKDAEKNELIALSLRQFVKQNNIAGEHIIISVPSQSSFARFVNLPPVAAKRIPEIVKFEAIQQIPFDINNVQWDWQMMSEGGNAESKVGIFAIKNEIVNSILEHFSGENIPVNCVQMAAMALYNYAYYDRSGLLTSSKGKEQAIVVLDIGAENTDLVVCTKSGVWQRCILMGGNFFTRAIVDAFKLDFEKAEKLKRTAPVSKYARQIFQAMKPVFTDLSSEIQRSLGFYSNANHNVKLTKIIAFGGGTKMRGLLKYLQQSLQIPVEKLDSFKKVKIADGVSKAKFHENISDFGTVYGLALQGLGLARIKSNLLPKSIARSMAWTSKAKILTVAAAVLLAVSLACFVRTNLDRIKYANNNKVRQEITNIIDTAIQASSKLEAQKSKAANYETIIKNSFEPLENREVIPLLYQTIVSALPNEKNNPEQKELYAAFVNDDADAVMKIPRKERKQIFITDMSIRFTDDIAKAEFKNITSPSDRSRIRTQATTTQQRPSRPVRPSRQRPKKQRANQSNSSADKKSKKDTEIPENKTGFVVSIIGYSPYGNIAQIIDPVGVGDNQSQWGFITRLMHTETISADNKSPFELYEKSNIKHFDLKIAPVDIGTKMSAGIGVVKSEQKKEKIQNSKNEQTLVDPMTREIISKIAEVDQRGRKKTDRAGNIIYKANDNWFVLNVKFAWNGAPETKAMETKEKKSR